MKGISETMSEPERYWAAGFPEEKSFIATLKSLMVLAAHHRVFTKLGEVAYLLGGADDVEARDYDNEDDDEDDIDTDETDEPAETEDLAEIEDFEDEIDRYGSQYSDPEIGTE